jgi:hypothetical protein
MSLVLGPAAIPCSVCLMQFLDWYRSLSGAVIRCLAVVCYVCRIPTVSLSIILTAAPFSVLISYISIIPMLAPLSMFIVFSFSMGL